MLFGLTLAEAVEVQTARRGRHLVIFESDAAAAGQLKEILATGGERYQGHVAQDRRSLQLALQNRRPDALVFALHSEEAVALFREVHASGLASLAQAKWIAAVPPDGQPNPRARWAAKLQVNLDAVLARPYRGEQLLATLDRLFGQEATPPTVRGAVPAPNDRQPPPRKELGALHMMGSSAPSKPELQAEIRLTIHRSDGWVAHRELAPGDTLTVGSKASCGLCLEDPSVAPIHCILKFVEGGLWVQDWYSSGGTRIDGRPVSEETRVLAGETIELGAYFIRTASAESSDLGFEVASSADSIAAFGEAGLTGAEWDPWPAGFETRDGTDSPEPLRSFEQETIDLLRAEVGHLQQELALREQQLADARSLGEQPVAEVEAAVSDPEDTARLVAHGNAARRTRPERRCGSPSSKSSCSMRKRPRRRSGRSGDTWRAGSVTSNAASGNARPSGMPSGNCCNSNWPRPPSSNSGSNCNCQDAPRPATASRPTRTTCCHCSSRTPVCSNNLPNSKRNTSSGLSRQRGQTSMLRPAAQRLRRPLTCGRSTCDWPRNAPCSPGNRRSSPRCGRNSSGSRQTSGDPTMKGTPSYVLCGTICGKSTCKSSRLSATDPSGLASHNFGDASRDARNDMGMTVNTSNSTSATDAPVRHSSPDEFHTALPGLPQTERLLAVTTRVEGFLLRQVQRLESLLADCPAAGGQDLDADQLAAGLCEERRQWEDLRQQQARRLEAEAARLVEAWQRLEAEQRRLLAQRESLPPALETLPGARPGRSALGMDYDRIRRSSEQGESPRGAEVALDDEPLSPELAVMQFQQLRREILRHRRQER